MMDNKNAYEQLQLRLDRLLEDKAELIKEFRKADSAGVRQLISEDMNACNNAIEKVMAKMEAYTKDDQS